MAVKMIGTFQFSEASADVDMRHLIVEENGTSIHEQDYAGDAKESNELHLLVGAHVRAELVDSDKAGNDSEPGVADFTVTDTIPPPAPGMMGFTATGQVDE